MIATRGKGRPRKKIEIEEGCDPKSLYNAHKLNSGENEKLLLILLFASNEELRLLLMHPEFFAADTTNKTNKEKKELFTLASKDGNNEGFNGGRAFIPSGQQWVFHYLFKHCLPMFWGTDVTHRIRLTLTDGDTKEYLALMGTIAVCNVSTCSCYLCLPSV